MGSANGKPQMNAGESLNVNEQLVSSNGRYRLIMQADGNLVGYEGNQPFWATGTNGKTVPVRTGFISLPRLANKAIMQADGNFVLYAVVNQVQVPVWATATNGRGGTRLVMQNDRNVVIYNSANQAVWSSNTGVPSISKFQDRGREVDYPGGDLNNYPNSDPNFCADRCNDDPRCAGFVTAADGQGCWTKSTFANPVWNDKRPTWTKPGVALPRPTGPSPAEQRAQAAAAAAAAARAAAAAAAQKAEAEKTEAARKAAADAAAAAAAKQAAAARAAAVARAPAPASARTPASAASAARVATQTASPAASQALTKTPPPPRRAASASETRQCLRRLRSCVAKARDETPASRAPASQAPASRTPATGRSTYTVMPYEAEDEEGYEAEGEESYEAEGEPETYESEETYALEGAPYASAPIGRSQTLLKILLALLVLLFAVFMARQI